MYLFNYLNIDSFIEAAEEYQKKKHSFRYYTKQTVSNHLAL